MKTSLDCPNAARDVSSGLHNTTTEGVVMQAVPAGASLQTDRPLLRVAHKCVREKCTRWQENRCGAAKKMLEGLHEKELIHNPHH